MKNVLSRFNNKEIYFVFIKKYGKHISTVFFSIGFIVDFLYLPTVDNPLTPLIGILYSLGFGFFLMARSFILTKAKGDVFTNKISNLLSLLLSFFSGSVLSFIFVLYYRSSYLAAAIPFFLFSLLVIFANEYIKTKKYRTYLDVSIYYFAITAVSIFLIPIFVKIVSSIIFIVSLLVSLVITLLYSYGMTLVLDKELLQKKTLYILPFFAPFAFAFLYFTNSIPPLPLSITSAKIYHALNKEGTSYYMQEEVRGFSTVYHVKEGDPLYFFTTIFAPSLISAPIEHVWERYDEDSSTWKEISKVSFSLLGGRKEGYRGYSLEKDTTPGKWRISVFVDNKRLLGRHYFTLESSDPLSLKTVVR